jgi:hypothetical protein
MRQRSVKGQTVTVAPAAKQINANLAVQALSFLEALSQAMTDDAHKVNQRKPMIVSPTRYHVSGSIDTTFLSSLLSIDYTPA